MNPRILSHKQKIDELFSSVSTVTNPQDQSEWAKYLCVLVSGFIEQSIRVLLEEYCKKRADLTIQKYVIRQIGDITNCKTNKIREILGKFSDGWKSDFDREIEAKSRVIDQIRNSLDSVVANRHDIAHGKSVGMSYSTISRWYDSVKVAVDVLEDIVR
jgi:hypothetical protein